MTIETVRKSEIAPAVQTKTGSILRKAEPLHINLTLYSNGPDQEFATKRDMKATNNWGDWAPWSNSVGPTHNLNVKTLGEMIKVRHDGFVTDMRSNKVFYADEETINNLTRLLSTPLDVVRSSYPEVIKAFS